jgi:hypothetical protein
MRAHLLRELTALVGAETTNQSQHTAQTDQAEYTNPQ